MNTPYDVFQFVVGLYMFMCAVIAPRAIWLLARHKKAAELHSCAPKCPHCGLLMFTDDPELDHTTHLLCIEKAGITATNRRIALEESPS